MALMPRSWRRAKARLCDMFFSQLFVKRYPFVFVLGSDRTAANQVARAGAQCVPGDSFPKHVQHRSVAVVLMHAGAAKLEDFRANAFEGCKVKKLLTVVAEIPLGAISALQSISSD